MSQPTPLPSQITYGNMFRPKGYYTTFKEWPVTPLSSNQYWTPDQIVRFMINVKSGVMDPYRSHIELLVTIPLQSCPVGGMQVDNSAQSFIAQTVISSNNVQIQRIAQYDTLAAYLTDIGFSQYVCQSRVTQGLGYSNIPSHSPWTARPGNPSSTYLYTNANGSPQWTLQSNNPNLAFPTTMPFISGRGNSCSIVPASKSTGQQLVNIAQVAGQVSTPLSFTNALMMGSSMATQESEIASTMGRFNNVRQQYASMMLNSNFPDTSNSYIHTSPQILNQTWTYNTMNANNSFSGFNPKCPYQPLISATTTFVNTSSQEGMINPATITTPNICGLYGYQRPISGQFCRGTCQTLLSPTIPQCQMKDGNILPAKVPVNTQLFRIPLISSVCGIAIPIDQFLLIPMEALYNLLLQVTLSRYGMFSTGYCDVHEFDQYGMSFVQQRKWVISQIYWNLHLYTFSDSQVNKQIQASLVKTITITTTTYTLASQFQLPNGQVVRNSWPVGTQCESLCEVICIFLSNEFNQFPFCRKQFRLSNNISGMQIKFGTQFFPSQPIIGNAGNPYTLDTTGDAWPFYQNILLSTNFMFNTNIPFPKINVKNFSINSRCYNPANTQSFLAPTMNLGGNYIFTPNSMNTDTAMGMSHFHQNRYVGKAAFVYTWQPYGHSKNYMTGLNTQGVQNFSVIFNTTGKSPFPSDETLLIFTRANAIVIYSQNGIRVLGK